MVLLFILWASVLIDFDACLCDALLFRYYDPASDGYYFEMPSVDGWKKRQPNSSSTSSSGSGSGSSTSGYKGGSFMRSAFLHQESPQVTSYGAALARGQLPPAYTLADSAVGSQVSCYFSSSCAPVYDLFSLSPSKLCR